MALSAPLDWLRARGRRRALDALRADMEAFFAELRGTAVLFFANPGNAGDSLIAAATWQAFTRNGIEAAQIGLEAKVDDRVVILGGGGNFIPLYREIKDALERYAGRARKIVILPHTIRGNEDVLRQMDARYTVFCRDERSLDHVRAAQPDVDVRLSHDMAFHLDAAALLRDAALAAKAEPRWRQALAEAGADEEKLARPEGVDLRRVDVESTAETPRSDIDISEAFRFGTDSEQARVAAWCFLKSISVARHIVTDRLHVAIGAALLGTPCRLHDNSYGKNAAVYRHSLAGRFPSVSFVPGPADEKEPRWR